VIDRVSRPVAGRPHLAEFNGKVAGLMSASPGALGGVRGLPIVRFILSNIGVLVLADQLILPKANQAFDAGGGLTDPEQQDRLRRLATRLAEVIGRLITAQ
jgi:NAD(P)H-dependent FMN reductase